MFPRNRKSNLGLKRRRVQNEKGQIFVSLFTFKSWHRRNKVPIQEYICLWKLRYLVFQGQLYNLRFVVFEGLGNCMGIERCNWRPTLACANSYKEDNYLEEAIKVSVKLSMSLEWRMTCTIPLKSPRGEDRSRSQVHPRTKYDNTCPIVDGFNFTNEIHDHWTQSRNGLIQCQSRNL